jgi:hypothetical protein
MRKTVISRGKIYALGISETCALGIRGYKPSLVFSRSYSALKKISKIS